MKINIILAIIVVCVTYLTCKGLQKNTPDNTAPASAPSGPAVDAAEGYNIKASHVIKGENPDNAPTLQIRQAPKMVDVPINNLPPATASRKAYLGSGWWHMNMAYQASDSTVHRNYQPKFLKFRQDQTFDVLVKNKVVDTGRWNWDETKNEIYLVCKDPYINNTWHVTEKGFVMIWKGNTDLNVTGIQIRVVGTNKEPSGE